MKSRSKRYQAAKEKKGKTPPVALDEAVVLLKQLKPAKFDETVEVAACLGIDPKKSDQQLRGSFALPHGIGKEKRVIVFAEGAQADEAKTAGAIEVGGQDLCKKIEGGWLDFDVAICVPEMMRHVGKLGRILGPQGKMPSPKSGTVTTQVASVVGEFRAGKIEYRTDAGGIVHAPMGKRSFPDESLKANIGAFISHISSQKPASSKGVFLKRVFISTTMGPSIQVTM
ncbi:MAG: 50S ribosomal protein L1 [Planctomycetota bacterium]|nr:50S ribosomal protein L1 [Planctomycetota bacterium]